MPPGQDEPPSVQKEVYQWHPQLKVNLSTIFVVIGHLWENSGYGGAVIKMCICHENYV